MKTALVENTWLRSPEKTDWIRDDRPEPRFKIDCGWGNGYVLIPEGHPLHGTHYDNIDVDVHGGLTFSELVTEEMLEIFNLEKEDIGKWCVGFDTAHYQDTLERWPKERVQEEADNLLQQLIKYKR